MKKIRSDNTLELDWLAAVGMALVVGLVCLFALNAAGGWAWTAKFLESSAAAWVQAIGSVAAIIAAIAVVNKQHVLEIHRRKENDRIASIQRMRALSVIFFSIASKCETASNQIEKNFSTTLIIEILRDARVRLISIDPFSIPNNSLLLILERASSNLYICSVALETLSGNSKEAKQILKTHLETTAKECWLGHVQATKYEMRLENNEGSESYDDVFTTDSFKDFDESRELIEKARERFMSK